MTSTGTTTTAFCIGAAYGKPCAALGVIDKVDRGIAKIIDGYFIHNDLHAVGFKGGVHIAEVIVQSHAKVYAAASAAGNIYTKGKAIQLAFGENITNSLAGCGG